MGLLAPPTPVPSLLLQGYPSRPFSRPFTVACCLRKAQHSPSLPNSNGFFGLALLPSETPLGYPKGDRVAAGLPRASCSVWGLDSVQERCHNTSPGDLESTFIKAEDRTRKGSGWKKQQESRGGLLRLPGEVPGEQSARWKGREKGAVETGAGGEPGRSCRCSLLPGLQVLGDPSSLGERKCTREGNLSVCAPQKARWLLCFEGFSLLCKGGDFKGDLGRIFVRAVVPAHWSAPRQGVVSHCSWSRRPPPGLPLFWAWR